MDGFGGDVASTPLPFPCLRLALSLCEQRESTRRRGDEAAKKAKRLVGGNRESYSRGNKIWGDHYKITTVLRVALSTVPDLSGSGRLDMPTRPVAAARAAVATGASG